MNGYKIHKINALHGVDIYQSFIIGFVSEADTDIMGNDVLRVGKMEKLGSHATIHKALMTAIKNGFLAFEHKASDKRVKFLRVTQKGKRYLENLQFLFN